MQNIIRAKNELITSNGSHHDRKSNLNSECIFYLEYELSTKSLNAFFNQSSLHLNHKTRMEKIVNKILLILVLTQWAIITTLIARSYHQVHSEGSLKDVNKKLSKFGNIDSKKHRQNQEVDDNIISSESELVLSSDLRKFAGVAATIMLNSPKWFQRRYTAMISNVFVNIPSDWAIQIFYVAEGQSQFGLDINPGILRLASSHPKRIFLTKLPSHLTRKFGVRKAKSAYWSSDWVWEQMVADRVFVFDGNGALCTNSKRISFLDGNVKNSSALQLFDNLDYIGSPWRLLGGRGGEGTFSYRNRTAMLQAIRYKPNDAKEREDFYFVKTLLEMNQHSVSSYRLANVEQTAIFGGTFEFSEEDGPPFVISGTLGHLEHDKREMVLSMCPELKIIFPVLHNPNCFGARPNGEECAKHICALSDPSMRQSGC